MSIRLDEARSSLVAMISSNAPSMDLEMTDALLDFYIFKSASELFEEYRQSTKQVFLLVEEWMLAHLFCEPIVSDEPACFSNSPCKSRFSVTLPSPPMDIPGGFGIHVVSMGDQTFRYVPSAMIPMAGKSVMPPSERFPAYSYFDGKVYLFAGARDLSKCNINISYIPGKPVSYGSCATGGSIVPHPPGAAKRMVSKAFEMIIIGRQSSSQDIVDDDIDQSQGGKQ